MPYPTHNTLTIVRAALGAAERLYRPRYTYHKAGVMLMDLSDGALVEDQSVRTIAQRDLFVDESRREMAGRLMEAIWGRDGALGR